MVTRGLFQLLYDYLYWQFWQLAHRQAAGRRINEGCSSGNGSGIVSSNSRLHPVAAPHLWSCRSRKG